MAVMPPAVNFRILTQLSSAGVFAAIPSIEPAMPGVGWSDVALAVVENFHRACVFGRRILALKATGAAAKQRGLAR